MKDKSKPQVWRWDGWQRDKSKEWMDLGYKVGICVLKDWSWNFVSEHVGSYFSDNDDVDITQITNGDYVTYYFKLYDSRVKCQ